MESYDFLGSGAYPVSAKYFIPTNLDTRDKTVNLFPVIRLTEMKYIMAEYYARNGNVGEAYRILNEIRENRGFMEVHLEDRLGMNLSRNYSMIAPRVDF